MGLTWYFPGPIHIRSQNSKLWPWDFFLTPLIFGDKSKISESSDFERL